MEKYELALVLEEKASLARKKKLTETVEKIVSLLKGKVGKAADWGVINGQSYLFFLLELLPSSLKMLSTKLEQELDVVKKLLIKKD